MARRARFAAPSRPRPPPLREESGELFPSAGTEMRRGSPGGARARARARGGFRGIAKLRKAKSPIPIPEPLAEPLRGVLSARRAPLRAGAETSGAGRRARAGGTVRPGPIPR